MAARPDLGLLGHAPPQLRRRALVDRPADHSASAGHFVGEPVDERTAAELARRVAGEAEIGPSSHATAEYRREMVAVLVKRALIAAAGQVPGT